MICWIFVLIIDAKVANFVLLCKCFMKHLLTIISILVPIALFAQGPSPLKKASEITTGRLANGISYYLVQNDASKGYADLALVQKGNKDHKTARAGLSSLPHMGDLKPYRYLSEKGVGYTISGLVSFSPAASTYRFQNVPMFDSAAADSILLVAFDLMSSYPGDQAIIMSGDITPAKILERMQMLSMLVSARDPQGPAEFPLDPTDSVNFFCSQVERGRLASIQASWFSKRVSKEDMPGTQPLIADMFAQEASTILSRRIREAFRKENVPLADVRFRYRGSLEAVEQERFTVSLTTDRDSLVQATELLARVMADFDARGAAPDEFALAKSRLVNSARSAASGIRYSNPQYVNKCVSAFLFGSSLSDAKTINDFYASSSLDPQTELKLMNSYMSSLVDSSNNVILHYASPELLFSRDSMVHAFDSGWAKAADARFTVHSRPDTLRLPQAKKVKPKDKVKIKTTETEPVSGGKMWTLSNGMKVVFKKVDTKGEFRFGVAFSGGPEQIPGLQPGDADAIGGMLKMYGAAGMGARDFWDMLEENGIQMEAEVGAYGLDITGTAPDKSLQLLLKSFAALSSDRKFSERSFRSECAFKDITLDFRRRSIEGVRELLDSELAPYYAFGTDMDAAYSKGLPAKAEWLYSRHFSSWDNAVIVIVGGMDENAVSQAFIDYSDLLPKGGTALQYPKNQKPLRQGRTTIVKFKDEATVGDGTLSVNVAYSCRQPFNLQKEANLKVLEKALRKELVGRMAEYGMYVDVGSKVELVPTEAVTIYISCRRCTGAGLPDGISDPDMSRVTAMVRESMEQLRSQDIPGALLKGFKVEVQGEMALQASSADMIRDAVIIRYSQRKDILTGRKDAVNSVTAASVKELAAALSEGACVEYVVK